MSNSQLLNALVFFEEARSFSAREGFLDEQAWQRAKSTPVFSEQEFLRESAWVILCSGFREATVQRIFDYVSLCFCDWESTAEILRMKETCKAAARKVFANERKLDAIIECARWLGDLGVEAAQEVMIDDPVASLTALPFIGPITALHLAKNLGLDVAKPDRHLVRLADHLGFSSVAKLCRAISEESGERVAVVDVILWRYLAQTGSQLRTAVA